MGLVQIRNQTALSEVIPALFIQRNKLISDQVQLHIACHLAYCWLDPVGEKALSTTLANI
jgi:hypothetical protein